MNNFKKELKSLMIEFFSKELNKTPALFEDKTILIFNENLSTELDVIKSAITSLDEELIAHFGYLVGSSMLWDMKKGTYKFTTTLSLNRNNRVHHIKIIIMTEHPYQKLLIKLDQHLTLHDGFYSFTKGDDLWMALNQKENQQAILKAGYHLEEFYFTIEVNNHQLRAKAAIKDKLQELS